MCNWQSESPHVPHLGDTALSIINVVQKSNPGISRKMLQRIVNTSRSHTNMQVRKLIRQRYLYEAEDKIYIEPWKPQPGGAFE